MSKVLFIVPHEDDELFVGGPLLIELARDINYEVYVFIATNGDYYPYEASSRILESTKVLNEMGVDSNHIIFGGYGNNWKGKHLYNSGDDENKESIGGLLETYCENGINEWHFQKFNEHQIYNRNGYLKDLENLIETILPDNLVCVDLDPHSDHRCLSLLTEEALGNILKRNDQYRPIVLKKFAYEFTLFGRSDFFKYPHLRSFSDCNDTWNPYYKWNDRISYIVPKDCNTIFLKNNLLYKLSKMYKSQDMWTHASSFINTDIVYWQRNTNNECLHSEIEVSSGVKSYLNDFKLVDSNDVLPFDCDYSKCWRPDSIDKEKEIKISFKNEINPKTLNIYFNCLDNAKGIYTCVFKNSSGKEVIIEKELENNKQFWIEEINIENIEFNNLILNFSKTTGNIGIGEIEILNEKPNIPFKEYLFDENKTDYKYKNIKFLINILLFVEKVIFKIKKEIYYKTDKWIKDREEYDKTHQI